MKAAFVKRKNRVRIKEVPKPEPKEKEIRIKIDACGVCGSDFIEAQSWAKRWKRFGHEIVLKFYQTHCLKSPIHPVMPLFAKGTCGARQSG